MKNFVVIGGSSGIGKSLAENLEKNNHVYASYNTHSVESGNIKYFHYNHESPLDTNELPEVIHGLVPYP